MGETFPVTNATNEQPAAEPPATACTRPEALLIPDVQAAALAGVSRATWHRLRVQGKVPAPVRLGRAVRWNRADIVAWIEAACPDSATWNAIRASAGRRLKVS
jgi:predicted DNA-binding transcriptional regulator AlpA